VAADIPPSGDLDKMLSIIVIGTLSIILITLNGPLGLYDKDAVNH
jgi:hypothetical protein